MGLFNVLKPKSFKDLEAKGDRLVGSDDLGLAKLEYEKSLERLLAVSATPPPEDRDRIEAKIRNTCDSLARQHLKTAGDLVVAECRAEAAELLSLARGLSRDTRLQAEIDRLMQQASTRHDLAERVERPPDPSEDEAFDPEDADGYYQILLSTLPEDVEAEYRALGGRFQSGYVALNQGNFYLAEELLAQCVSEFGARVTYAHLALATAKLNLGQADAAADLLEDFIQAYPQTISAYESLCEIYWERGEIDLADRLLQSCPDKLKRSTPVLLLMGETLHRSGKTAEAVEFYLKSMQYLGWQEPIAAALAAIYEAAGKEPQALEMYREIVDNCKSCHRRLDPFVRHRYVELLYATGETSSDLLENYFALCAENPTDQNIYYRRISDIYERRDHPDEAGRYRAIARQIEATSGDLD